MTYHLSDRWSVKNQFRARVRQQACRRAHRFLLWTGTTLVPQPGSTITTGPVGDVGTVVIHKKALLAGVLLWPIDAWRVNADVDYVNNDNASTRISPTSLVVSRTNLVQDQQRSERLRTGELAAGQ